MTQLILLLFSVVVPALTGFLSVPFLSRSLSPQAMGTVSIVFLIGAFFGSFDVLRPVFVRSFTKSLLSSKFVPIMREFVLSMAIGVVIAVIFYIVCVTFFASYMKGSYALLLSMGGFLFSVSVVFWAVLDSVGRAGSAQAIRAFFSSMTYFAFCIFAYYKLNLYVYMCFFSFIQFFIGFVFYFLIKSSISWKWTDSQLWTWRQVSDTVKVNASKIVIDFSDRLILSKFFSVSEFSAYSIIYDTAAKFGILPQYVNAYIYPRLCLFYGSRLHNEFPMEMQRLIFFGLINFFSVVGLAFLASYWSQEIVGFYIGEAYRDYGNFLTFLLLVFSIYSMAFYGQSYMRAVGDFSGLAQSFNITSFLGIAFGVVGFFIFGNISFVLMVLFLKSPGVGMFLRMVSTYYSMGVAVFLGLFLLVSVAMLSYSLLSNAYFSFFALIGFVVIVVLNAMSLKSISFTINGVQICDTI